MKTLGDIKKRIDLRNQKIKEVAKTIVQQLKEMGALKIVLFGSFVLDKIGAASDLDILVIMPDSQKGRDWLRQIYTEIKRSVACDFFVFNEEEYENSKDHNPFLKEIIKKGRIAYEKRA